MIIKQFQNEYLFLSNFYPSPFTLGGKSYKTVEHYYQSQKADIKEDREKIRLCETPGKAKRLGRKVKIINVWEETKELVMTIGLRTKFEQNKGIAKFLILTEDSILIEGNYWHDNYWGDCYCQKCLNIKGQNKLGKMLMKVRKDFKMKKEKEKIWIKDLLFPACSDNCPYIEIFGVCECEFICSEKFEKNGSPKEKES